MISIKKTELLEQVNAEISKLPDYDPSIKIIDISVDRDGNIDYFLPNVYDITKSLLAKEYMEAIDHVFQGKYNILINNTHSR
ncbi:MULTISPECIES: hypothetical protein [unclassified Acinetobacter]|uniref:hypothetical protein n=1 Tax=unclassified Acinetobacter TaxID=196816 RepID=UPI0019099BB7|nr:MULTISPECIES: hypothetical protein [unclassified Acinetobacter]MBK0063954.1 hypothetical protein [Acinetobacter sp. S55]MBK0067239.1 hypothetical protein [Acinetobacter sp. S54]